MFVVHRHMREFDCGVVHRHMREFDCGVVHRHMIAVLYTGI